MTSPSPPPPGAPLDALPPDAPATVEDVRASRRWTWVALAWAVAASIVAVIALIQNSNDNNNNSTTSTTLTSTSNQDVAAQIAKFQKDTNDRLDALSRRLNDTASSADLQKLDKRVSQISNDVSTTKNDVSNQSNSIKQLQSDVKDLQGRVSKLESQQKSSSTGTTTTP